VLYTQHNVSKSDRSYIAGRVRSGYILYLAFAVSMLLLYSAINAAFADAGTGHRNISQLNQGGLRAEMHMGDLDNREHTTGRRTREETSGLDSHPPSSMGPTSIATLHASSAPWLLAEILLGLRVRIRLAPAASQVRTRHRDRHPL
jgi:hypothetical protein